MFYLRTIENTEPNAPVQHKYDATTGEAIERGEMLVLTGGKLTKCGATVVPTHVAMESITSTQVFNRQIMAAPIQSNMIFEVPVMAAPTSLKVGEKVTLHTDGLQVTATTSSGVATIVDKNGATAEGDTLYVKF